ncbi:hypothetical protein JCM5353_008485 [Sporobolomyces roseus]
MSTEYHDLSDSESPDLSLPTSESSAHSDSAAQSNPLPSSNVSTFILPQTDSPRPHDNAQTLWQQERNMTSVGTPFQADHSPWKLQWKKYNSYSSTPNSDLAYISTRSASPTVLPTDEKDEKVIAIAPKRSSRVGIKLNSRACVPCKKQHTVCSDQRPCPRCRNKGIQHLCIDAPDRRGTANDGEDCIAPMRDEETLMLGLNGIGESSEKSGIDCYTSEQISDGQVGGAGKGEGRGEVEVECRGRGGDSLSPTLPPLTPDSSPLHTPSSPSNQEYDPAPPRIPPNLGSLPHDIVHEIVDQGGPDFVFPLANRHLLPFHISTLYRTVRLGTPNLGYFQRTLKAHTDKYASLIRILVWDASPSIATLNFVPPPDTINPVRLFRTELKEFVNLEEVHLVGHAQLLTIIFPQANWFDWNPKLRRITVRSFDAPTEAIFDMSNLSHINGLPLEMVTAIESSGILLQIRKLPSSSTFKIRYCGGDAYWNYFLTLLGHLKVVSLHYCNFSSELDTLCELFNNFDSRWLFELWLFILREPLQPLLLPNQTQCPHLYRLSLGGNMGFPIAPIVSQSSSNFAVCHQSLDHLHVGPGLYLLADRLLDILRMKKREGNRLKTLKLDNIFSALPFTSNPTPSEWALPQWTPSCRGEDVEKLRDMAKEMKIEISGTTFLGLEILESEEYRKAVEQQEEEEAWESDEE